MTKILLVGQVLSYLLVYSRPEYLYIFQLTGKQLLQGQLWRLVTIIFAPVSSSLLFVIFVWYFFYLFSTALENQWGSFRYLSYIFIAYIATILFTLFFPNIPVSNIFIYTSLFLAFTHLYPDFQLLLFFIIPVKVKWLGYFTWFGLLVSFLFGPLAIKVLTLFSVSNFFLFFHGDLRHRFETKYRGVSSRPLSALHKEKPLHVCAICGHNEKDNHDMEIRYCSQCVPTTCYCGDHIKNHQHKRVVN